MATRRSEIQVQVLNLDQLKALNAELVTFERHGGTIATALQQMGKAASETARQADLLRGAVERQNRSVSQLNAALVKNADAQAKANTAANRATDDTEKAARAAAAHYTQQMRVASAMRAVGTEMTMAGAAITGAYAVAIKSGMEFNRSLQAIQANTGISDGQLRQLTATVQMLGTAYGGSMDKIAAGEMHAINLFHDMAAAQEITVAGAKAAIATHGNEEQVINGLAKSMKEWNIPMSQANETMNGLIFAANRANVTLPEMMNHTDRLRATFANLKLPLSDMLALYATLTQHGLNAAMAETQMVNVTQAIIRPNKTKIQSSAIDYLTSTIDPGFAEAFSLKGLQQNGYASIFDRMRKDADALKIPVQDLAQRLVPNLRGSIAGLVFTGTGVADLRKNMEEFHGAFSRQTELNTAVKNSQDQLAVSVQKLQNQFVVMASEMANSMAPGLKSIMNAVTDLFKAFERLDPETRKWLEWTGLAAGATLLVGGRVLSLASTFMQLKLAIEAARTAQIAGGVAGAEATGGGLVGGIPGVIAVAGAAGLGYLADRHMQAVEEGERRRATATQSLFGDTKNTVWDPVKGTGTIGFRQFNAKPGYSESAVNTLAAINAEQRQLGVTTDRRMALNRSAEAIIADQERLLASGGSPSAGGAGAKSNDFAKIMADWDKSQKDAAKAAKAAAAQAKKDATQAKRDAKEAAEATSQAWDELFGLTHPEADVRRRDIEKEYRDRIDTGVPGSLAAQIRAAAFGKMDDEQAKEQRDRRIEQMKTQSAVFGNAAEQYSGTAEGGRYLMLQENLLRQIARMENDSETLDKLARGMGAGSKWRAEWAGTARADEWATMLSDAHFGYGGAAPDVERLMQERSDEISIGGRFVRDKFVSKPQGISDQMASAQKLLDTLLPWAGESDSAAEAVRKLRVEIVKLGADADAESVKQREKQDAAIESLFDLAHDRALQKFDFSEMPVAGYKQYGYRMARNRRLRDLYQGFADESTGDKSEQWQNRADELSFRMRYDQADRMIQEQEQTRQAIDRGFLAWYHGQTGFGGMVQGIGSEIVDKALTRALDRFSDPLVIGLTDATSATRDLTTAVKNNTDALTGGDGGTDGAGGSSGSGGSGGMGGPRLGRNMGKWNTSDYIGAGSAAYSMYQNGAQNGVTMGGVLGAGLAGFELGGPWGAVAGVGLDLLGGIFGHKKSSDPRQTTPAYWNQPSDFDYYAYRFRATGQAPNLGAMHVDQPNAPVVHVYVDGKEAATRVVMSTTRLANVSLTSHYFDGHTPL